MKSTFQLYIETGYPIDTLERLAMLESSSEYLGDLLESYRYLQPDGELFSVATIAQICHLHELEYLDVRDSEELEYHERITLCNNHEIQCVENGHAYIDRCCI